MATKIDDYVQEFQELKALVDQWRGTEVEDWVRGRLSYRHSQYGNIIVYLARVMNSIANAEGIWLDYIGNRLGLRRPQIETSGRVFGFAPQDVSFNQGPFASEQEDSTFSAFVGDPIYRKLLYGRAVFRLSNGSVEDSNIQVKNIFRDRGEHADWTDNFDRTATLDTFTPDRHLYQLAREAKLLDPPLGIRRIIPLNDHSFTGGTRERFRGVVDKSDPSSWLITSGDFKAVSPTSSSIEVIGIGTGRQISVGIVGDQFIRSIMLTSQLYLADAEGNVALSDGIDFVTAVLVRYTFTDLADFDALGDQVNMVIADRNSADYKG